MIPVFKPCMDEREIEAVAEIIRSGWIGLGPKTAEFETAFADYVGAKYAVAVNSATAALHLSCLAAGVKAGDEVLVPAISFVSTAHAVGYCGATPVFVDIAPDSLNISPDDARAKVTSSTRAIIPVHYGGCPCNMPEIWELADEYGLAVIEDAAHACGVVSQDGKHIGNSRSDATCFSFHAVKNLATGDGGMITTNRVETVRRLHRLRWCGINKGTWERTEVTKLSYHYSWYYEVEELGYKYHMNDIVAAIGLVQLSKLDQMNTRRGEIAALYDDGLGKLPWLRTAHFAHHNYVIKTLHRDALNLYLHERGISTGVHYMPLHLHPCYRRLPKPSLPTAERVWLELLTLPFYPDMTDDDVATVIGAIIDFGKQENLDDAGN